MEREPTVVVCVDELLGGRRHLCQDPQPAERVAAREERELSLGDRVAAHSVEAVAAGDEVALQHVLIAFMCEVDRWTFGR